MEVITKSARETKELGKKLATSLKARLRGQGGEILALSGELGSGKTTFVQGLAEGLGIEGRIISPTFILMRRYDNFYHIDLYRLEKDLENEVKSLGLADIWNNPQNIVVVEWAEKITSLIPKRATWIKFENLGQDKRKLKID